MTPKNMALSTIQQIWQQITQARRVAIFLPHNRNVVAGAWALQYLLYNHQKTAHIFSDNQVFAKKLDFLPYSTPIYSEIELEYTNQINIKVQNKNLKSLKYEFETLNGEDLLTLQLTSDQHLAAKDIILGEKSFNYDLIINLNAPSTEMLGSFYVKHQKFFKQAPVVNIDIDPDNELYGHINLVKIQENSIANLLLEFYLEISPTLLNRNSSSLLLSQLLLDNSSETNFKNHPLVKELIRYGADYRLIMDKLFHQNDSQYLQCLGTVLKNLQIKNKVAVTMLSQKMITPEIDIQHFIKQIVNDTLQHVKEIQALVFSIEENQEWKHIIYDFSGDHGLYYKLNRHYHVLGMNQNQIVLSSPLESIESCQDKIIRALRN
ncbi:MAG TPA: hypothetical protein PLB38_02065 [bacterium]|nr:hypothetical protein [bacterium]